MSAWPAKEERELLELNNVIKKFCRLFSGCSLLMVRRAEQPDFIIKEENSGVHLGLELTSVYLTDRSVPDRHKLDEVMAEIPYHSEDIDKLLGRIIEHIQAKIIKAKNWQGPYDYLILAVLLNEYELAYLGRKDWEEWLIKNDQFFDAIDPFNAVIFYEWDDEGEVFITTPSGFTLPFRSAA